MSPHDVSPCVHSKQNVSLISICENIGGPGLTLCPPLPSAGGTGVLLNVDRVSEQLEGYPGIQVRGLSDSGWFLDNKQYRCTDCVDTISCAPTEAIKRGIK